MTELAQPEDGRQVTRRSPGAGDTDASFPLAYKAILLAAALWVTWFYFRQVVTFVLALVLTAILAMALTAFTDRLERLRVPRPVGALLGLLLGLAAVATVLWLVLPTFIAEARTLVDELPGIVDRLQERLNADTGAAGQEAQAALRSLLDDPSRLLRPVMDVGSTLIGLLILAFVVALTAVYVAISPSPIVNGLIRIIPPPRREHALHIMRRVRRDWMGWLAGVLIDMVLTGALTYAALSLIGLDYALLFAVFTGLLEFVPYFGPIVASIPPVLFALTQSPELAVLAAVAYVLVQQIEGQIIVPLVMSQTVRLHPAVIAIGIVLMGKLFGFAGLFVAIPILSLSIILVQELWVFPRERAAQPGDDRSLRHRADALSRE